MSNNNQTAFTIAFVPVIIGALNWGLVGIDPSYNLIEKLFDGDKGNNPTIRKVIYIVVGVAAVVATYLSLQYAGDVCGGATNAAAQNQQKKQQ